MASPATVFLKVRDQSHEMGYKVSENTKLEKIMKDFCERFDLPVESTRFSICGVDVAPNDTAEFWGLQDEAVIEADTETEARLDPADGLTYTRTQFFDYYSANYSEAEIQSYWHECMPADPLAVSPTATSASLGPRLTTDSPAGPLPPRRGVLIPKQSDMPEHIILVPILSPDMTMEELAAEVEQRIGHEVTSLETNTMNSISNKVLEVTTEADVIRAEVYVPPAQPGHSASSAGPLLRVPPRSRSRGPLGRRRVILKATAKQKVEKYTVAALRSRHSATLAILIVSLICLPCVVAEPLYDHDFVRLQLQRFRSPLEAGASLTSCASTTPTPQGFGCANP